MYAFLLGQVGSNGANTSPAQDRLVRRYHAALLVSWKFNESGLFEIWFVAALMCTRSRDPEAAPNTTLEHLLI